MDTYRWRFNEKSGDVISMSADAIMSVYFGVGYTVRQLHREKRHSLAFVDSRELPGSNEPDYSSNIYNNVLFSWYFQGET